MARLVGISLLALLAVAGCADSVASPSPVGQAATVVAPPVTLRGTCTTTKTAFYTRYDYGTPSSVDTDVELAVRLDDAKTAITAVLSTSAHALPADLWAAAQISHAGGALQLSVDKTVEVGRDTLYDTSFLREQYTCTLREPATSDLASVARPGS